MKTKFFLNIVFGFSVATIAAELPRSTASWHGVIAFTNDPENASEDWNWFSSDVHQACKENGGYSGYGDPAATRAKLGPRNESISVSRYLKRPGQGWLLVKNGKVIKVLPYDIASRDEGVEFCKTGLLEEAAVQPGAEPDAPRR